MLPGWVTSNEESVAREAADYVEMSPEEKAAILAILSRGAASLMRARPDADLVYQYRDPIPDETLALLRRLRDAYRRSRPR